jgi:hypothetical protein
MWRIAVSTDTPPGYEPLSPNSHHCQAPSTLLSTLPSILSQSLFNSRLQFPIPWPIMKDNYTRLYPNEQVAIAVGDYAFNHSTKLPKHITDHHAWGVESQERASYMISPLQAQFQVWFAKALGAKRSEFLVCITRVLLEWHVMLVDTPTSYSILFQVEEMQGRRQIIHIS